MFRSKALVYLERQSTNFMLMNSLLITFCDEAPPIFSLVWQSWSLDLLELRYLQILHACLRFCLLTNCKSHLQRLIGNYAWSIEDLTKALIFVVDNQGWGVRCALLSAPIAPSMGMKSQPLH